MRKSAVGSLIVASFLAACSTGFTPAPPVGVTPSCAAPPTFRVDGGTPIPIVLTCDHAIAAGEAALPAEVAGREAGNVVAIVFAYGLYCTQTRCGPMGTAGRGDVGFVQFVFADGSSWLDSVKADQNGVVSVTGSGPTPTSLAPQSS